MASLETVTVGCKLPHGLHLDVQIPGEGKKRITVNGLNSEAVIGGFGITENVPKDFFEKWAADNAGLEMLKKGLLFAYKDLKGAESMAKERESLRNGLERLDPENPGKNLFPEKTSKKKMN